MKKQKLAGALAAFAATFGLVAVGTATPAQAAEQKPKVGYTQVTVAPAVYKLVAGAGITPAPVGGAKAFAYKNTLAARFPITNASLRTLKIKHSGGISLTAGSRTIALRRFTIDLKRLRVSGKVSGSIGNAGRVNLFKIRRSSRPGLGVVRLTLTKTAAQALNATFRVHAFSAGDTFGYATPRPFARF
ncbi:hypothetical protein KV102_14875 [Mumia sp. zg.B53]|uniref:hypothetical protein n=1 Tax=unclassified Mumia TaxID=2621872 RepID=UPI001C6F5AB8|nr:MULTISPECIES: hypothetical protein [unclassified Mumia]MBW9205830.1 hypothetical protein [Mumia sp. zg.B17]MBW9208166.1 hypothetical protein [Mumia sp. zg.B21]MBW9216121.1 hypothetical protein [Mumia sp. zg.B53]MDD9348218.1 hypothetical protein [Mumia sp.]